MRTIRRVLLPLSLLVASCCASRVASAQQPPPIRGQFSVQRFEPAPGPNEFFSVEQLRMYGAWGWSAGFVFDYARDPFALVSCASRTDCSAPNANRSTDVHVVRDLATWDFMASVSPVELLQIGLRVPLMYSSGQGVTDQGLPIAGGIGAFGLGDIDLEAKLRVVGRPTGPIRLGLAGDIAFPTGNATAKGAYIGNDSVTGGVRGIFDAEQGPVSFAANVRGVFRESATVGSTTVGPAELRYGAGLGLRLMPILRVLAEGFGSTQFSSANGTNTLEIDGALLIRPLDSPVMIRLGGGAGILEGVGVPSGRAILGLTFIHEVRDTDGDGIPDDVDKCPTLPEDFDGFEDADGCPDPDNDKDGVPDAEDRCPNVPGPVENHGCPEGDRDGDGIPDTVDKCPDEGGKIVIRNPKSPYYGCPDRDDDGIPDVIDKCPDEPEDTDGFEDADGCPDPDNDHDGIPDERDECINEPETYNGYQDADGCPDTSPTGAKGNLVEMGQGEIKIVDAVEFEPGRAAIKGPRSFQVLDAVAAVMKNRQEIQLVEVQGRGGEAKVAADNRALAQQRAESVVKYLTGKGVPADHLSARGYVADKVGANEVARVQFAIAKATRLPGTPPPPAVSVAPPAAPPASAPKP